MTPVGRFEELSRQTHKTLDAALEEAGRCMAARAAARKQLEALHGYRDEYVAALNGGLRHGIDAAQCRAHERFIDALDKVIVTQGARTTECEQALLDCQEKCARARRDCAKLDVIVSRQTAREAVRERRREQSRGDEVAARVSARTSALSYRRMGK
ncbi:MAG: flagellar export protein FliJ [Candidimonas sp.]|nr:MAG: flagellar export protein FliJ [Candidimonas sp.]